MILIEAKYGDDPNNFRIERKGDTLSVELVYPPRDGQADQGAKVRYAYVNQESGRASDGIRIHYDYLRDGFVIEQASTFSWQAGDQVRDMDWQEVAFIESWARDKTEAP